MSGVMVLAHCQVAPFIVVYISVIGGVSPTLPSGSSANPLSMSPTIIAAAVASAPSLQNVTLPISSSLVTVMVTSMESLRPPESLAVTVTE